jgi:hypothetical protein
MKNRILPLFVLALFGCSKPQIVELASVTPHLDEQFQIKIGQTVNLGDDFSFAFDSVPEDSRCPKNVVCIWSGNAAVALKFPDGIQRLNTTQGSHAVIYRDYSIELIQLAPYPESPGTISTDAYTATLKVTTIAR